MKKIRINELARDLEVKANLILDKLPDLGVTEKKTHSSSVDEDVAEKLREIFVGGEPGIHDGEHHRPNGAVRHGHSDDPAGGQAVERKTESSIATEEPPSKAETVPETTLQPELAVSDTTAAPAEEERPTHRASLRPPLARPVQPPLGGVRPPAAAPPQAAAPPASTPVSEPPIAAAPPVPAVPQSTAPAAHSRPSPPAARPIPTAPASGTRPGQVLSGPRAPMVQAPAPPPAQPVPGQSARPASATPGAPRPYPSGPRPQSGQPLRPQGAARPGVTPGAPIAPRPYQQGLPGGGRPLAGQPAPRPIVPPNPDLVRKLSEQQRMATPGAPAPARPGMPQRPPHAGAPGRPIFPGGGVRPGQPQRPGQAGPYMRSGVPGRPGTGGPRPMHPTSPRGPLGAVGLVPAPTPDQARRPTNRGSARPQPRDREREAEGKLLRPMRREREQGPPPINRDITISEGVTVKELSEKLDVKANLVIKKLLDRGIFATINQTLDSQLATEMAREFGASTSTITFEEEAMFDIEIAEEAKDLFRRPPVVTIMGHVDHGKTSLLDAIRKTSVADREAGGITQHIGAYFIEKNGQKIVFIDTPGHEAFTRMRSRGAKVTDVVVLVVAADDGVMPQTLEAIDHARAAKVPIVVAINKIDRPEAQPERIKQQLSDRGLLAEDWGGDVVMVPVSARTKEGLDQLLEMILLVAEIQDLKANPSRPAMGSVIESKLDRGRGPVATVLVRNGTLHVGDFFICGQVFGKVRAMINDRGEQLREAGPSMPVEVLGLDSLPDAGDEFQVVTDTTKAKQIVMYREEKTREEARAKNKRITLEQFQKQMAAGETKELPIILKADVAGSAEVLSDTLQSLSTEKVKINVLRAGVGAINEGDVLLASASTGIVIGFNVKPDRKAEATAEQEKVDIRLYSIIYNLTDDLKKAMAGMLAPVFKEIPRGKAEVRNTFRVSKVGMVAGCMVTDGSINRDCQLRVIRDKQTVHTGKVGSLRRFKDDVSEVRMGMECGITIDNYGDIQVGDLLEAFTLERQMPTLGEPTG
jgi:translation initiation factor IF-2